MKNVFALVRDRKKFITWLFLFRLLYAHTNFYQQVAAFPMARTEICTGNLAQQRP